MNFLLARRGAYDSFTPQRSTETIRCANTFRSWARSHCWPSLGAHGAETLYVGGSGGSTEKLYKEQIIPPFEAKTGAKVVYVPGNSTDILAKLQAQKGKQEISVALIDDGPMYQAVGPGPVRQGRRQPVLSRSCTPTPA